MGTHSSAESAEKTKPLLELTDRLCRELDDRVASDVVDTAATDQALALNKLRRWQKRAADLIAQAGLEEPAASLRAVTHDLLAPSPVGDLEKQIRACRAILRSVAADIEADPEFWSRRPAASPREQAEPEGKLIFLGHGGSPLWNSVQHHLEKDLGREVLAWESEARAGHHSVEILNRLLRECGFAVMVVTAEDVMSDGQLRARQNVVHEIGLFQGRLGFQRVALLIQDGVEVLSNLAGLQVIPFTRNAIDGSFYKLDAMLRREGLLP